LALSRGHHLELPLPLALATLFGMRRSEILGLQWPDFDFLKGTLTIHRVRRDERTIAENGHVSVSTVTYPPKSASSWRQIPMGSIVQAAVLAHRQRQQERGYFHPVGWLFATRTANPVSPSRLSRVFKGFPRENNIREIRFHDVRHTAVTLSLEAGVRIEVVSHMVGHSRIDTTKSIYAPVVQAIDWGRGIEGLTSPQAFVLWVICDRYNEETHSAWPSIKSIARDTRLASRTVSRALGALGEKRLLVRGKTFSAHHDGWASNTYCLPAYDPRSRPPKNVVFQEVRDYESSLVTFRTIDDV
jgi:hypothetical protein